MYIYVSVFIIFQNKIWICKSGNEDGAAMIIPESIWSKSISEFEKNLQIFPLTPPAKPADP